jgi:hypothetical protein
MLSLSPSPISYELLFDVGELENATITIPATKTPVITFPPPAPHNRSGTRGPEPLLRDDRWDFVDLDSPITLTLPYKPGVGIWTRKHKTETTDEELKKSLLHRVKDTLVTAAKEVASRCCAELRECGCVSEDE